MTGRPFSVILRPISVSSRFPTQRPLTTRSRILSTMSTCLKHPPLEIRIVDSFNLGIRYDIRFIRKSEGGKESSSPRQIRGLAREIKKRVLVRTIIDRPPTSRWEESSMGRRDTQGIYVIRFRPLQSRMRTLAEDRNAAGGGDSESNCPGSVDHC